MNGPPIPDCTAVLLAGGQSSRMGQPKPWLDFGGRPLLVHLVERLLTVAPSVIVVAAPGQMVPESAARVMYDDRPGEGPLGGMAAGLRAITTPLAFVVACDVPFLKPAVARHLVAGIGEAEAAVPVWEGRRQPLQAVYAVGVGRLATELLARGDRRAMHLLDLLCVRETPQAELRLLDPRGLSFFNVNTPEDYQRARELWEEHDNLVDRPP